MIHGMIELLTPRTASGWAYAVDDPTMPLTVRARDGEAALAQVETGTSLSDPARQSYGKNRGQTFSLDFPAFLNQEKRNALTIEAAPRGSNHWHVLPRYLNIGGPYLFGEPALLANPERKPQPPAEPVSPIAMEVPFWSDAPGSIRLDSAESYPVFVLGSARSGTSAVTLALKNATRYQGFPEGHVLDVAIRIAGAVNAHFEKKDPWLYPSARAGFHLGRIAHPRFQAETIELVRRLAAGYTTPYWFDKTPSYQMVASVPILAQAWPNARFIYMKRRGMENVQSRIRKFARSNFAGSCRDWTIIMAGWRTVRDTVPGRFIEIDQHTMAADPVSTSAAVGVLLDLTPEEVGTYAEVLRSERPESTGPAESIIADLSELNWTAEQIATFREICGDEMAAYGYTYDGRYCC